MVYFIIFFPIADLIIAVLKLLAGSKRNSAPGLANRNPAPPTANQPMTESPTPGRSAIATQQQIDAADRHTPPA